MSRHKQLRLAREEGWRRAHASRPRPALSGQWRDGLMGEINAMNRQTRVAAHREASMAGYSRLLFRFAGAGAVLALALLLYAHLYAPDLDRQAAGVILEQPATPVSLESLIWS
jgi:hypothetical protein